MEKNIVVTFKYAAFEKMQRSSQEQSEQCFSRILPVNGDDNDDPVIIFGHHHHHSLSKTLYSRKRNLDMRRTIERSTLFILHDNKSVI